MNKISIFVNVGTHTVKNKMELVLMSIYVANTNLSMTINCRTFWPQGLFQLL